MSVYDDGCSDQGELILDLPGTLRPGVKFSPRVDGGCCFEDVDGRAWAQAVADREAAKAAEAAAAAREREAP